MVEAKDVSKPLCLGHVSYIGKGERAIQCKHHGMAPLEGEGERARLCGVNGVKCLEYCS